MNITITRDPRTREIQIRGPDGFVESLDDQVISQSGLLGVQRVLNAVYEAGRNSVAANASAHVNQHLNRGLRP